MQDSCRGRTPPSLSNSRKNSRLTPPTDWGFSMCLSPSLHLSQEQSHHGRVSSFPVISRKRHPPPAGLGHINPAPPGQGDSLNSAAEPSRDTKTLLHIWRIFSANMAQVNTCLKRTFTIFNIFFAVSLMSVQRETAAVCSAPFWKLKVRSSSGAGPLRTRTWS